MMPGTKSTRFPGAIWSRNRNSRSYVHDSRSVSRSIHGTVFVLPLSVILLETVVIVYCPCVLLPYSRSIPATFFSCWARALIRFFHLGVDIYPNMHYHRKCQGYCGICIPGMSPSGIDARRSRFDLVVD